MQENKRVCVLGLGYVGLPSAAILATRGYEVYGVDVRKDVVETINKGEIHIREPDLDMVVRSAVKSGQLTAGEEPIEADIFILCVPTPIGADHQADLSYVEKASEAIRPYVKEGNLIILESTSPPGTTENLVVQKAIPEGLKVGESVFVAHCPERVLPGRVLLEVIQNDRVIGGVTSACVERAKEFYESFVSGDILATTATTAEVTKLMENAFRDVNIALANELSLLSDRLDIDAWEVIEMANRHPRVNILSPGPGVGGHCISVDPWFLVSAAPDLTRLIRTAREVNDSKPQHVVERVVELAKQFSSPVVGCLGLAYKADIDDLRESPSLEVVRELQKQNLETLVCEPYVSPENFEEFELLPLADVIERSQILVLLTDHKPFLAIPQRILQEKILVDTKGVWRRPGGS